MSQPVNFDDFRNYARRKLPRAIFDFVDSGSGDEVTTRANEEAFRLIKFAPRPMTDVSERSQKVKLFDREISMPVMLGPAGSIRLVHRDGEAGLARAAARAGTGIVLSSGSNHSIEDVAEAAPNTVRWFQLYLWRSRDLMQSLVKRADEAGYHALVLTVDNQVAGTRDRDVRNGLFAAPKKPRTYEGHMQLSIAPRARFSEMFNAALHPRWLLQDYLLAPPIVFKNVTSEDLSFAATTWSGANQIAKRMSEVATWDEVRFLRSIWRGPLIVKGVLTAESARLAFDHGADGVVVSNHGGRHLDGLPATIDVLPRIVKQAKLQGKEVFVDGGVRRGIDVVKAIALGARACLMVRPYAWGLAYDGEAGVGLVLDNLRREIDSCLGLIGRPRLSDLDPSALDFTIAPWHRSES